MIIRSYLFFRVAVGEMIKTSGFVPGEGVTFHAVGVVVSLCFGRWISVTIDLCFELVNYFQFLFDLHTTLFEVPYVYSLCERNWNTT